MQCVDISGRTAPQARLSKDAPTCSNTASTRLWRGNIDSASYVQVGFAHTARCAASQQPSASAAAARNNIRKPTPCVHTTDSYRMVQTVSSRNSQTRTTPAASYLWGSGLLYRCATGYKCCSMPVVVTPRLLQSNNTACVRAALSLDDAATAAGFAQCCHVHVKVIECDSASSNKLLMKQVAAELERTSPRSRVVLQHYSDGGSS